MADWVRFLREEKLWGNEDPLFPATKIALGPMRQFEAAGLDRKQWSTAAPIRAIFHEAFDRAALPYFHPHSLRKTLTRLGGHVCKSAEEYKAWSQNLGHEQVLTTFMSYGKVPDDRQGEIIRALGTPGNSEGQTKQPGADDIAEALFKRIQAAALASGRLSPPGTADIYRTHLD